MLDRHQVDLIHLNVDVDFEWMYVNFSGLVALLLPNEFFSLVYANFTQRSTDARQEYVNLKNDLMSIWSSI